MKNRIIALALCAGMLLLGGCASHDEAGAGSGDANEANGGQAVNSPSTTEQAQPEDTRTSFEKLFDDGPLLVQDPDGYGWGYIDATGNYVIEPKFNLAYDFQENGLALVNDLETKMWGYINTSGEYVIEPQFSDATQFDENGYASVVVAQTKCGGIINESGEYVIEPEHYGGIGSFSEGFVVAGSSGYQYYLNEAGEVQFSLNFQEAYDFVDGWAVVNHRGFLGYISTEGEHRIFSDVKDVFGFNNGRAFVQLANGKYKLIDENLEYVTDTEFDDVPMSNSLGGGKGAARWYDGICFVGMETQLTDGSTMTCYYAINTDGEIIFPTDNKHIRSIDQFREGYATALDADTTKWGIIDRNGNWTVSPQYETIAIPVNGVYLVGNMSTSDYKYIDSDGNVVLDSVNPNVVFSGAYRDILQVRLRDSDYDTVNQHYSFVDHDGNFITDLMFEDAMSFSLDSSYAKVKYNGLWGFIDGEGNWLIEPQFQSIGR